MEKYFLGNCVSLEKFARSGGGFHKKRFDINSFYLEKNGEKILIDTGYSIHFKNSLKHFPNKIYGWVTIAKGIERKVEREINTVIITHFHADHIGGLKEYPNAKIICSKKEYEYIKKLGTLEQVRKGFILELLPDDFEERVIYIENLPKEDTGLEIFEKCHIYNGIKLIFLEGHTIGQFGILEGKQFYVSDAIWCRENLIDLDYPSKITKLIHYDFEKYCETVKKIRDFQDKYNIEILFTHGEI